MNNWQKNILYILLSAILYFVIFIEILPKLLSNSTNLFQGDKYVIIVGDFQSNNSFGKQVLTGFKKAYYKAYYNKPYFKYIKVNIDESLVENVTGTIKSETRLLKKHVEKELIKIISTKNVISIISANTSQTIEAVLNVGKTFNIPVLITVSTKESLSNKYKNIYFRLLADNNKQGKAIIKWAKKFLNLKNSTCGVLYSPTKYGYDLLQSLRSSLGNDGYIKIIPFSISTTTDIVGSLKYGKSLGVSSWVSLSYLSESIEIMAKKNRIDTINPILFSDGAYGLWLEKLKVQNEKVFLSFPKTYNNKSGIKDVKGFGVFGYDAFFIIHDCITNDIDKSTSKSSFIIKIANYNNSNIENRNTIQTYRFVNGENINSNFKIYSIKNDLP